MAPQELVNTLIAQHRMLQADLGHVQTQLQSGTMVDYQTVVDTLMKFRTDLSEHLKAESDLFYPDYLRKKLAKGEDVTQTKEFIKDMDTIGVVVMKFLDTYNKPEVISASLSEFKTKLEEIISVLQVRIETEEEGVFGIYILL